MYPTFKVQVHNIHLWVAIFFHIDKHVYESYAYWVFGTSLYSLHSNCLPWTHGGWNCQDADGHVRFIWPSQRRTSRWHVPKAAVTQILWALNLYGRVIQPVFMFQCPKVLVCVCSSNALTFLFWSCHAFIFLLDLSQYVHCFIGGFLITISRPWIEISWLDWDFQSGLTTTCRVPSTIRVLLD